MLLGGHSKALLRMLSAFSSVLCHGDLTLLR